MPHVVRVLVAIFVTATTSLLVAACSDDAANPAPDPTTISATAPPRTAITVADSNAMADPEGPAPVTSEPITSEAVTAPATTDPVSEALVAERPVDVIVPDGLTAGPAPLVVVLHGYTGTADVQQAYFRFQGEAATRGVILAYPDGTADARGAQFWNATDACCNFFGSTVDDVAYVTAVVDHVGSIHAVDPARIYLAGHSNGGFMSYRLACERADLFAAVVSLAGATFSSPDDCTPSEPVSVAQVHGTLDEVIAYDGGEWLGNLYPSAATTAATWASHDGCSTAVTPATSPAGDRFDIDSGIIGAETTVARFSGCPDGVAVELWTISGGRHIPELADGFAMAVFDFFEAHPKTPAA